MNSLPSHEFWRYSLKVYGNTNVRDLCLSLQNRFGININLILFCCWFSTTGRGPIAEKYMRQLLNELKPWHQGITEGLRELRHRLSNFHQQTWAETLRKEILADELTAEQIEQLLIITALPGVIIKHRSQSQKINDCICNFHTYITSMELDLDQDGYDLLQRLLLEVFPSSSHRELEQISISFNN